MVNRRKNNWVSWSDKELRLLKKLFPLGKVKEVVEKTGRSLTAAKKKAYSMGLGTRQNRRWMASEIELVKRLYPTATTKSIAESQADWRSVSTWSVVGIDRRSI